MGAKNLLIHATVKNRAAWYYVRVSSLKAPIIQKMVENGQGEDLSRYSEIVASGWGKEPPEAVQRQLKII